MQKTRTALIEIATTVHQRAPRAKLVFVDYATVLPATGTCPARLPFSEAQMAKGRSVAAALSRITSEAAEATKSLLVKASDLTVAHDICAAETWIARWGISANLFGKAVFHPTEPSMRAVADAVVARFQ